MKSALVIAAFLAVVSAPAYTGLSIFLQKNGTLVGALAPGAATLYERKPEQHTVIALAD